MEERQIEGACRRTALRRLQTERSNSTSTGGASYSTDFRCAAPAPRKEKPSTAVLRLPRQAARQKSASIRRERWLDQGSHQKSTNCRERIPTIPKGKTKTLPRQTGDVQMRQTILATTKCRSGTNSPMISGQWGSCPRTVESRW